MDVSAQLKDAVEFLAPLFNDSTASIDELLEPDQSIAEYPYENTQCNIINYAGENAGHYLVYKHNNEKFSADEDSGWFLVLAGRMYAGKMYHDKKCGCNQKKLEYPQNMKPLLESFISMIQVPTKNLARFLAVNVVGMAAMADVFGYLMYKHYGNTKLGEYARMDAKQAMRFLEHTAELELRTN